MVHARPRSNPTPHSLCLSCLVLHSNISFATMSSNQNKPTHSLPIPIDGHRRSRSESVSDCSSDSASTSPASPLPTPLSGTIPLPRIVPISPSTSPILSYLLSQSPKSPPSTFPFRRGISGAIFQGETSAHATQFASTSPINPRRSSLFVLPSSEEDAIEPEKPTARHGRRASAAAWPAGDRFPQITPVPPTVPAPHQDRAAGLLRRLSLGGSLTRVRFDSPTLARILVLTPLSHSPQSRSISRPTCLRRRPERPHLLESSLVRRPRARPGAPTPWLPGPLAPHARRLQWASASSRAISTASTRCVVFTDQARLSKL